MNSSNESWVKRWLMPLATACCVMALVLLTVPITGTPATVMGGYVSGGGGSTVAPTGPTVTQTIGAVSFTVPASISMGTFGTVSLVISGPDAAAVNPASLFFAGAPVLSMYFDAAGNLVVIFSKSNMNLKPGDTSAMVSGLLKSGLSFSGAIPVTVVP